MKVREQGTQNLYFKDGQAEWEQEYSGVSASSWVNAGSQWGSAYGAFSGNGSAIYSYRDEAKQYLYIDFTMPRPIKPHNWIFETFRNSASSNGHPAWNPALWYWNGSSYVLFFESSGWDYGEYWRNYAVSCPVFAQSFRMRFANSGSSYEDEICIRNISLPSYIPCKNAGTVNDYTDSIIVPAYKTLYTDGKYYSIKGVS